MNIDYELEYNLKEYNHNRLTSFINYQEFNHIEKYDKILNARYCKVSRIKKRLIYLLGFTNYHYFCTFTFDNHYINKSDRTKRDLIKSCLNGFSYDTIYILNVDYGKQTEREHYHCIVGTKCESNLDHYLQTHYPCFSHCQKIRLNSSDIKRVSKYIHKLTNHCCKDSTRNKRIVYNFSGFDSMSKKKAFYWYCKISHKLGL